MKKMGGEYMPLWPMYVMLGAGGIMLAIPKMFQVVEKKIAEVAGIED